MRRLLATLGALAVATLAWPLPATGSPTYQWCRHGHCTRPHRAHQIECGGFEWVVPHSLYVPPRFRHRGEWWCEEHITSF